MDDRKLTELFRNLEEGMELRGPEPAFADALYGRLRTEAAPRRLSRPMVLLVAALLLVVAAAGAIAIGSGIIDPAPDDDAGRPVNLLPAHEVDCSALTLPDFIFTLSEGVFLEAEVGPREQAAYGEMRPGQRLTIFENGVVVVGSRLAQTYGSAPNPDRPLPEYVARRLSPTGIALVTRAVADSGLLLRDCSMPCSCPVGPSGITAGWP